MALVGELGADRVVDYTREPDFLANGMYDLIFDATVRSQVSAPVHALTARGRYVATLPSLTRIAAATALPIFSKKRIGFVRVSPRGRDLDELRRLCEAGALRPVIGKIFPLPELAAAYDYKRRGRTTGKIAVIVNGMQKSGG